MLDGSVVDLFVRILEYRYEKAQESPLYKENAGKCSEEERRLQFMGGCFHIDLNRVYYEKCFG